MCTKTNNQNESKPANKSGPQTKHLYIIGTTFNVFYLPCHWIVSLLPHSIESANQSKAYATTFAMSARQKPEALQ